MMDLRPDVGDAVLRKTILHLAEFSPHSAGTFVDHLVALGNSASRSGWTCWLGLPVTDEPREWYDRLREARWRIRTLRRPWGLHLGFVRDLRDLLAAVDPSIVHLHFNASSIVPLTLLAPHRIRVIHWHNPPRSPKLVLLALDRACRPRHVAVGADLAKHLRRALGGKAEMLELPNGVQSTGTPASPSGMDLLAVQAFRPQKDHDTLIRAVRKLAASGWTGRLRWVGTGPQLAAARASSARLGIADRIDFLGQVDSVRPLLAESAMLVLSTRYEGQPYAILEAMAHGRPVIASDVPGCRELLGELAGDLCVPAGDPDAMEAAIRRLIENPDRAVSLGRRLRESVRSGHSLDAWTAVLLEHYAVWLRGERI